MRIENETRGSDGTRKFYLAAELTQTLKQFADICLQILTAETIRI